MMMVKVIHPTYCARIVGTGHNDRADTSDSKM
jgi:hypothetical protein